MLVTLSGSNALIAVSITTGNNKTITVPAGKEYTLKAISLKYIASATVGNRDIVILVDNGTTGNNLFSVKPPQISSGFDFVFAAPGLPKETAYDANKRCLLPLPDGLVIPTGCRIRMYDELNVDATGDTLAHTVSLVERSV